MSITNIKLSLRPIFLANRSFNEKAKAQRVFSTTPFRLDDEPDFKLTRKDLTTMVTDEKRGIFRVLDIGKPKNRLEWKPRRSDRKVIKASPREKQMKPEQDWMSVWPAQRTFHPAVVPLPIRQGFAQKKDQIVHGKYANVELMKIPNFLHLTPPVIKKQCQLLKKYCTKWPAALESQDVLESHYPVVEMSTDFLNASSSIRDNRSRILTVQFKLSSLFLDYQSRDKYMRLLGDTRYNIVDDKVTISSDRLPYRKQNRDYIDYLVKALYFESRKHEDWEVKADSDLEKFSWETSRIVAKEIFEKSVDKTVLDEHRKSITELMNEGENVKTVSSYKKSAQKMLGLKDDLPVNAEALN